MSTSQPRHLSTLNPAQRSAAAHTTGPLLILAGAGAGKTKTLTHRILNLALQGVAPHQILAVTFTNKAASEMKGRLANLLHQELGPDETGNLSLPTATTFHSLGVRIIRNEHKQVGLPARFSILDRDDQKKLVREILKRIGYSSKDYDPNKLLNIISKQKMLGETFSTMKAHSSDHNVARMVWECYENTKKEQGVLDFDDLLSVTEKLLRQPDIRSKYHRLWTHVHIDEYQDTNDVQYQIARHLVGASNNICVVGDADQNIYSWRGANIKNILSFEEDFPGATTVLLEENYRSTKNIIAAANDVIQKNELRKEKTLFTNNADGNKIKFFTGWDENDEARQIAERAQALLNDNHDPKEIAVLYRANFQSRAIEEALIRAGIPYELLGVKFYERREVKDLLSYLKAALNPQSALDIARAASNPRRGLGQVSILKMIESGVTELSGKAKNTATTFLTLLENIREEAVTLPPSALLQYILQKSGLEKAYQEEGTEEAAERLANLGELISLAGRYDREPRGLEEGSGLLHFLDDASLTAEQDNLDDTKNGVRLMTVHASKGLEFDTVFLPGLEEGLFPMYRDGSGKNEEEEERRLFYVALTRARKQLYLSHAHSRTLFGRTTQCIPSEFIYDIDESLLENDSPDSNQSSKKSGGYLPDIEDGYTYVPF